MDRLPMALKVFGAAWIASATCLLLWRTQDNEAGVPLFLFSASLVVAILVILTNSFAVSLICTVSAVTSSILVMHGIFGGQASFIDLPPLWIAAMLLDLLAVLVLWSNGARAHIEASRSDWMAALLAGALAIPLAIGFFGLSLLVPGPLPFFGIIVTVMVGGAFVLIRQKMSA